MLGIEPRDDRGAGKVDACCFHGRVFFHKALDEGIHCCNVHVGVNDRLAFAARAFQKPLLAFRRRELFESGNFCIAGLGQSIV